MASEREEMAVSPEVPEALPGRVIVKFPRPKTQTVGGLIIPESAQRIERNVAEVVAVGAPTDRSEELFCYDVKVGDRVIAKPHYGDEFGVRTSEGVEPHHIFRMFEIIGKLRRDA
jgi:co-chaperonin GroES (HSP10)